MTIPDPIETATNEAIITFQSDNFEYTVYKGFSISFNASNESMNVWLIYRSREIYIYIHESMGKWNSLCVYSMRGRVNCDAGHDQIEWVSQYRNTFEVRDWKFMLYYNSILQIFLCFFYRYCDWRIKLPRGYHVVIDVQDLPEYQENSPLYYLTVIIKALIFPLFPFHRVNSFYYFPFFLVLQRFQLQV